MADSDGVKTIITALGGAGVGTVILEVVRRWAAGSAAHQADGVAVRGELFQEVKDLKAELRRVNEQLDQTQADYYKMKAQLDIAEVRAAEVMRQNGLLIEQNELLRNQIRAVEDRCRREHTVLRTEMREHTAPGSSDRSADEEGT